MPHPVRPNVLQLMNIILSPTSPHPLPSGKKKSQFLIFYKHYEFQSCTFQTLFIRKTMWQQQIIIRNIIGVLNVFFPQKLLSDHRLPVYISSLHNSHVSRCRWFPFMYLFISWSNSWLMRQRERERETETEGENQRERERGVHWNYIDCLLRFE